MEKNCQTGTIGKLEKGRETEEWGGAWYQILQQLAQIMKTINAPF